VTLLNDLIKFLNQTGTSQGKKIVMILEKMLELEQITRPIKPEEPMIAALEWKRTDPQKYQLHCEIYEREQILKKELSKYRFRPRAAVVMGGGGKGPSQWSVWWRGDSDGTSEEHVGMRVTEALEMILRLTQIGELTRLRRCNECQKWLFARFRHQAFCSTKCQQRNYTQSDAWKAHRRAYMRGYYQRNFRGK